MQRFHEQIAGTPHTWGRGGRRGIFSRTRPSIRSPDSFASSWRAREPSESAEEQFTQLESALDLARLKPAEALPLIAPLLNLPLPAKYPHVTAFTRAAAPPIAGHVGRVGAKASRQLRPTIVAIEDLHWVDPSTLELIQFARRARCDGETNYLIYTGRPEFQAQWPQRDHHTQIALGPAERAQCARDGQRYHGTQKALPDGMIAAVVERTAGVPLFVEELTQMVLESGSANHPARNPSYLARLANGPTRPLGPAKEVAQIGAVIGSEFSYGLLHAVHPCAEEDLQSALRNLSKRELIYTSAEFPPRPHTFSDTRCFGMPLTRRCSKVDGAKSITRSRRPSASSSREWPRRIRKCSRVIGRRRVKPKRRSSHGRKRAKPLNPVTHSQELRHCARCYSTRFSSGQSR